MGPVGSEPGKRPARISNIDQGIRKTKGGSPSKFDIPCSIFDIRSILGRSFLSPRPILLVTLSAAKGLDGTLKEILRCAQNDRSSLQTG
jgi:hypothetical protein